MGNILLLSSFSVIIIFVHAFHTPKYAVPAGFVAELLGRSQPKTVDPISGDFESLSNSLKFLSMSSRGIEQTLSVPESTESPEPSDEPKPYLYIQDKSGNDENSQCHVPMNPKRTLSIAGDYFGPKENYTYFDPSRKFFKSAMSFDESELNDSLYQALAHFKNKFGMEFDLGAATFAEDSGLYSVVGKSVGAFVHNVTLRVVTDSYHNSKCAGVTAVIGGWMFLSNEKTILNRLSSKGPLYEGPLYLANLFIVFMPGTKHVTRLAIYPETPFNCAEDGHCPISGATYNFEDGTHGWIDGFLHMDNDPRHGGVAISRLVAMWPGRSKAVLKDL